jgi:hypothetical protein
MRKQEIREAVRSGDGKALAEAVKKLPKKTREFNEALRIVKRDWNKLIWNRMENIA